MFGARTSFYDVTVTAEKSGSETVQRMEGEFAFSYAYSALYQRVPVTVEHNCGTGDIKIDGPTDREPHPGNGSLERYTCAIRSRARPKSRQAGTYSI